MASVHPVHDKSSQYNVRQAVQFSAGNAPCSWESKKKGSFEATQSFQESREEAQSCALAHTSTKANCKCISAIKSPSPEFTVATVQQRKKGKTKYVLLFVTKIDSMEEIECEEHD